MFALLLQVNLYHMNITDTEHLSFYDQNAIESDPAFQALDEQERNEVLMNKTCPPRLTEITGWSA